MAALVIQKTYEYLRARLGESAANMTLGLWYGAVILAIVIFGATPETTLRYLNL